MDELDAKLLCAQLVQAYRSGRALPMHEPATRKFRVVEQRATAQEARFWFVFEERVKLRGGIGLGVDAHGGVSWRGELNADAMRSASQTVHGNVSRANASWPHAEFVSEPEAAANDVFDVRRFRTVVVAMVCLLAIEAAFMFPPVKMTVFDLDSATKGAVLEVTRSYDMMAGAPWTPFRESWGEFTIDWPVLMFEVAAILVTRRSRASALETESGPHAGRRNLVWVGQDVIQPLQRLARLGLRIGYALWL